MSPTAHARRTATRSPVPVEGAAADAPQAVRTGARTGTGAGAGVGADAGVGPGAWSGVGQGPLRSNQAALEEFAHLLARAARQCRTYPESSPLCSEAIASCHKALARVGREDVYVRVRPRELIVDQEHIGAGTIVEQELARRLHRAQVAALRIDVQASPRDLTRFCVELGRQPERDELHVTLADALIERGVERIVPEMARAPEVLPVGLPVRDRRALVREDHARRAPLSPGGGTAHLYPPDRGWVRLDPGVEYDRVSLSDLALLVEEPGDLAAMLLRLTGDGPGAGGSNADALQLKFSDVSLLFASLEPRVARMMFARLAHAVLALDADRRTMLLQRTILPGLLDGRLDGQVLREFPDVDLAGALCLLLDLETAAPEVLATALDRLDLSADRRSAMVPLLEAEIQQRHASAAGGQRGAEDGAERYAKQLVRVEAGRGTSFADFAAFDLALDDEAEDALVKLGTAIAGADLLADSLRCLARLIRLETNPDLVARFLARAQPLLNELERTSRWADLAEWLVGCRATADSLRGTRPDVAEAIAGAVGTLLDEGLLPRLLRLVEEDEAARTAAYRMVGAWGHEAGDALVRLLHASLPTETLRILGQALCDQAGALAPALAPRLPSCSPAAARAIVRALGHAGAGYEPVVAAQLQQDDEQVTREALRALAHIGTPEAAAAVAARLQEGPDSLRAAAEEALWHFPAGQGGAQVRALLAQEAFVSAHPHVALRLLERAARADVAALRTILRTLAPLRFRIWSRARARLGQRAHQLLTSC